MHTGRIVGAACLALLTIAGASQAASLSNGDKEFMKMAATLNMTEAHEGQMAEKDAARADVKSLGQTLDQDHTQAYNQLFELASKSGVTIPTAIVAKNAAIEQLGRLKGNQFDRTFARDEVTAQERAVNEYKREAKNGQDPDVKSYASKMVPVMEKDLHLAEDCAKGAHHS